MASAASSSARSIASEPRAVATAATSAADSSEPPRAGRSSRRGRGRRGRRRGRRGGGGRSSRAGRSSAAGAGGRRRRGRRPGGRPAAAVAVRRGAGRGRGRRTARSPYSRRGPRSSRGGGAGSGVDSAASRLGAAPPRALRGAATIRAGSAPMPRTPRLPGVRISKSRSPSPTPNCVAGGLDGLLDGLAGELLVLAHVSVVSLVGRSACGWAGSSTGPRGLGRRLSSAPPRSWVAGFGRLGLGQLDRVARRVVARELRVPAEQREHPAAAEDEVLLDDLDDRREDPVEEQAGRQHAAVQDGDQRQEVGHLPLDLDVGVVGHARVVRRQHLARGDQLDQGRDDREDADPEAEDRRARW